MSSMSFFLLERQHVWDFCYEARLQNIFNCWHHSRPSMTGASLLRCWMSKLLPGRMLMLIILILITALINAEEPENALLADVVDHWDSEYAAAITQDSDGTEMGVATSQAFMLSMNYFHRVCSLQMRVPRSRRKRKARTRMLRRKERPRTRKDERTS